MTEAFLDAVIDTLKLTPILFLTYLLMEYLEHHTGDKIKKILKNTKKAGPIIGSAFGIVPQCGFSGAAANLYASGTVTLGTLTAVFISTSDEMLPILISSKLSVVIISVILVTKFIAGIIIGYLTDIATKKRLKNRHKEIHDFCEQEHCHCEDNIFISALKHTLKIVILIFAVTLLLNIAFEFIPDEKIMAMWNIPVIGELFAGLLGLIPNCSASVLITNLYVKGVIGISPMLTGLMTNAGVGLIVLYRVNKNIKENILITLALYLFGVLFGGFFGFILSALPIVI